MRKFGQFLAAFRAKEASNSLSADVLHLEGAEAAGQSMPPRRPQQVRQVSKTASFGEDAAYHLAASAFDPCAMTEEENRKLANLLLDAEVINLRDYNILVKGPARRCGTLADIRAPRNYLADWQDSLTKHMGNHNYTAVDIDSRALTILGKLAVARNAAA